MNWNSHSRDCFACLTLITDHLFVQPLTSITEGILHMPQHTYTCMHTHMHTYTRTHMYTCLCTHTRTHTCVHTLARTHTLAHTHTHTYTHTHTHTHNTHTTHTQHTHTHTHTHTHKHICKYNMILLMYSFQLSWSQHLVHSWHHIDQYPVKY